MITPRSTGDVEAKPFAVLPNPVSDDFHVNGLKAAGQMYEIVRSSGVVVQSGVVTNNVIDLTFETKGVLWLIVYTKGGERHSKK